MHEAVALQDFTIDETYFRFVMLWPYIFGLIVAVGTAMLAWSGDPRMARPLWWAYALLIVSHTALFALATVPDLRADFRPEDWSWDKAGVIVGWLGATFFLVALLPLTRYRCRNWLTAMLWAQLALAATAAICLTFVTPAIMLAQKVLIGGKLAIACSVFLIVATVAQRFDGRRALTRRRGESPLQFSLQASLVLMHLAGLALAWVGGCILVDAW